ncbi:MAG: DUF6677 family protein [Vicinamibacterales bacterium]
MRRPRRVSRLSRRCSRRPWPWVVPGLGHFVLGKRQKALVFVVLIPSMFLVGLGLDGRLFPFDFTQPLAGLAAVAARGVGMSALLAGWLGYGQGVVTAASYMREHVPHRQWPAEHARRPRRVRRGVGAEVMTSHLGLLILFAFFVAAVFATISHDDPPAQLRFGLRLFGGFVGTGLLLGWLMYPLPL